MRQKAQNLNSPQQKLLEWYAQSKRPFPWRLNRDPYRIWISETMLQQTTTTAVIPYFERFVERFPTLQALAQAPIAQVLEAWAGLGYYSRARNLHRAAQALSQKKRFPKSHVELLELPGLGPYTARAVASLAFDESVGVVDGNVIRVLSRFYAEDWEWWQSKVKKQIQMRADEWVQGCSSADMNQALMELGRTICTPRQPSCLLCPLQKSCRALKHEQAHLLPKSKPRRAREIWWWQPQIEIQKGRIALTLNREIPFLKGQWLPPGRATQVKDPPKKFHYRHSITHHDIFVTVLHKTPKLKVSNSKWVDLKEIEQHVPASLVRKALQHVLSDSDDRMLERR